jgi:hypothetical protein
MPSTQQPEQSMTTELKQALIGAMIRREYEANGGDFVAAFDKIMGAGAYRKLAGDVYNTLRNNS